MSETSGLRFQQAYDEARASITSSLNSVKDTYEGIQREFGDEMKGNDLKGKDLIASLHKATSEIEGLNGVVKTLEASLAASKDLAATAQKTLQDERAAAKAAEDAASKLVVDHSTYKTQVAAAEKDQSNTLATLKQELAVHKAQMEAGVKEAMASREDLSSKNAVLNSEVAAVKSRAEEWQREADKSKMEAEKSRSQAEAATAEKHAAQEARVLAEKDAKLARDGKFKADTERISKERDAKEEATKAARATAEAEKATRDWEAVSEKLAGLTTQHQELGNASADKMAAASSRTAWLEATLLEKETAIAGMKEAGAEQKKAMEDKVSEEVGAHEVTRTQLERLKQEAYNLYTAYTGAMQQLEEYRVALERESQESARLHQAMALQKQEAARDALRTSKTASMMLPPSSISNMNSAFGSGGGGGGGGRFHSDGSSMGNFEQFSTSPFRASNISELNSDHMGGTRYGGSSNGMQGGDSSDKTFAVD